jgi:hypothetical protein
VTDDEKPRTRWHPGEMPGPFGRSFWRSPIRGPWLTSVLGLILLAGVSVVFVTGKGLLGFYLFSWPTHPVWLYRVNQGLHVTLGLVLIPILLAKLWSVLPKLFEWPPLRSPAHALERLSLLLLAGGAVFEFVTGVLNIQQWYKFPGSFYTLHFYGAWVFVAGLVVHTGLKSRTVIRSLRTRGLLRELRTDTAHTEPEPPDASDLVSPAPAAPDDLPARRAGLRRGRLAGAAGPVGGEGWSTGNQAGSGRQLRRYPRSRPGLRLRPGLARHPRSRPRPGQRHGPGTRDRTRHRRGAPGTGERRQHQGGLPLRGATADAGRLTLARCRFARAVAGVLADDELQPGPFGVMG